tara:strand:+ start:2494 stop:6111 length:3618 start_codon:yes stop_codon:yes gene_type:complete
MGPVVLEKSPSIKHKTIQEKPETEDIKDPLFFNYETALNLSKKYFNDDELAAKVFLDKYALRDKEGNILEPTPVEMFNRITSELARIEAKKFKTPLTYDKIYNYLDGFKKIIPQGSPLYGIGNPYQFITLSNCYVTECPMDSYASICRTDEQMAQISKRRGGVGTDLSALRPSGTSTSNAARTSTGILSFMERYSNTIREVGQSGRRGALMLSVSVHHPQVVDFATVKRDRQKVTGANISVKLTDEFLTAVKENKEYEQRWPVDSKKPEISKMVNAREVWHTIIENAHYMAEPGLLFWDNIIRESPADCYGEFGYKTESTNPCITKDTWILTKDGNRQVEDMIGTQFEAIVDGFSYSSDKRGFYYTGYKEVYEISTDRGNSIKCTSNHPMKVSVRDGRERYNLWVETKDLKVGDEIVLSNNKNFTWEGEGSFEEGWLVGSLLGDGVFSENTAKLSYWGKNKEEMKQIAVDRVVSAGLSHRSDLGSQKAEDRYSERRHDRVDFKSTAIAELANRHGVSSTKDVDINMLKHISSDYCIGFIQGWMDADGTVIKEDGKQSFAVRLSNTNLENLKIAQLILLSLGISSTLYPYRKEEGYRTLPDGKGGYKEYSCKANHEIHISKDNLIRYAELIGFSEEPKREKLNSIISNYKRGPYKDRFTTKVVDVKSVGKEDVYDCTIPEISQFSANGMLVHNCSELPLSILDSCRLLLLNLFTYVREPYTRKAYFDYEAFNKDTVIAQRLMDDIVDLELECIDKIIDKVDSDPEPDYIKRTEKETWVKIREACVNGRRTGTGITALGDTLAALGIKYGSEKSIEITGEIYKSLKLACYRSSVEMAKELGPFPCWDHDLEKKNPFLLRIKEEDRELWDDMKKFGRRNMALLTTAPAGTVSIEAQTTSGIEPAIFVSGKRRKKINPNDENARTDFIDQSGDHWQEFTIYHHKVKDWMEITGHDDVEKSPWWGACAEDINWRNRVKLQAAAQKHVDHSISSTVNLPEDVSVEEVAKIYETAWEQGLKGITVYRKGCRTGVLVDDENKITYSDAPKRPKTLTCEIHHTSVKGEEYFVIVGLLNGKQPYEIFAGKNGHILKRGYVDGYVTKIKRGKYQVQLKNGTVFDDINEYINEDQEALTRTWSMSMRHGIPPQFIVHQLEKTKGPMTSFCKAVGRILKKYIEEGTKIHGEDCLECGANLIRSEGCAKCVSCGWSKCA